MIVIGCLLLVILPLAGLTAGAFLIGTQDAAIWLAAAGFLLALATCGAAAYALVRAGRHT